MIPADTDDTDADMNAVPSSEQRQPEVTRKAFLRQLDSMFHDHAYLHCPESPWKGLPG